MSRWPQLFGAARRCRCGLLLPVVIGLLGAGPPSRPSARVCDCSFGTTWRRTTPFGRLPKKASKTRS